MIEELIGNLSAAVHPLMEAAGSWTVGSLAKRESSATAATTTATCFTSTVVKEIDPSTSSRNCGRVCVACNTSKTPLWRGGPKGPKSLCNACGIKYRKARRALAAAADAADSGGCFRQRNPGPFLILDDDGQELVTKPKKQYYRDLAVKYAGRGRPKKLAGISAYSTKCADLIGARDQYHKKMSSNSIGRSKPSAFHRVFPKDEEEAAMLLMALSGGLVFL